ncbi:phosphonate ABC transporter, permease protein PhnE [Inquilinus sp. CA228]|uniref:phosphonate ABC transporter, permease protein PhnE n=1 Tax=Inquilinus sp. CA228 TaxID=3455609 RepID=UPI003F8D0F83
MAQQAILTEAELAALQAAHPRLFRRSTAERARSWGAWLGVFALFGLGLWWIDASPARIWGGLSKLGFLVRLMLPPSDGGAAWDFSYALLETLAMAFLGTLLAVVAAVPLGFLGARNIVPNWVFHFSLRRLFDGFRGIDTLVWALIFVSAVGMGPFAGILAIAFSDVAVLAKLYAEAIEGADRRPVEGVRAAGANGLQSLRLAVLPQVLPLMLSHALYFFESNTRSAAILGIVGAGGIGLQLSERIRINNWDEVLFIILMILATVAVIDAASRRIRMAIIRPPARRG